MTYRPVERLKRKFRTRLGDGIVEKAFFSFSFFYFDFSFERLQLTGSMRRRTTHPDVLSSALRKP